MRRNYNSPSFLGFLALALTSLLVGCGIYSFQGGKLKPGLDTVSIELLDNNASLIVPTLSQDLTEALKDRFISQSNLRLVDYEGDLQFSGAINQYRVAPVAITGDETASETRLSLAVQVQYECPKFPEDAWQQNFTQFSDFDASLNLSDVQGELILDLIDKLTNDIFNKVLSNW